MAREERQNAATCTADKAACDIDSLDNVSCMQLSIERPCTSCVAQENQ